MAKQSNNNNNKIWVFLYHSNKDYEKVGQVRNMWKNRICKTIVLSKSMDKILSDLQDFINKTHIFISYNSNELEKRALLREKVRRDAKRIAELN